jgi:hypothetical protein
MENISQKGINLAIDYAEGLKAISSYPINKEKLASLARKNGVGYETSAFISDMLNKMDSLSTATRDAAILQIYGLLGDRRRLLDVTGLIKVKNIEEHAGESERLMEWWNDNGEVGMPGQVPRGAMAAIYLAGLVPLHVQAMVELKPDRALYALGWAPPTFVGKQLKGHIIGRSNTHISATTIAVLDKDLIVGYTHDGSAVQVATGASCEKGDSVISLCCNAAPSGTLFDFVRSDGSRLDTEFMVRVFAGTTAQILPSFTMSDMDGSPALDGDGTIINLLVSTEANMKTFLQQMTLGGETAKSVNVVTLNNQVVGVAYFTVSTTTNSVAIGGQPHGNGTGGTACFIEVTPLRLSYRTDTPVVARDSSGNSVTGQKLVDLVGKTEKSSLDSIFSDATYRYLGLRASYNRMALDSKTYGGPASADSTILDQIIAAKPFSYSPGTVDEYFWFSLPRWFSRDTSISATDLPRVYEKWYSHLKGTFGGMLCDNTYAQYLEEEALGGGVLY